MVREDSFPCSLMNEAALFTGCWWEWRLPQVPQEAWLCGPLHRSLRTWQSDSPRMAGALSLQSAKKTSCIMQRNHGSGSLTFAYCIPLVQVTGPARTHVEGIVKGVKPGLCQNSIDALPIELAAMGMSTSLLSTAAATGHMWLLNTGYAASATVDRGFQFSS